MTNDAAMFLRDAGQKTGRINEGHQRNIETITHADEARHLIRGIDVDNPSHNRGFLSNDAHAMTTDTCQPHDRIACPIWLDFKKRILIDDLFDNLMHNVRLGWIDWHNPIQ